MSSFATICSAIAFPTDVICMSSSFQGSYTGFGIPVSEIIIDKQSMISLEETCAAICAARYFIWYKTHFMTDADL